MVKIDKESCTGCAECVKDCFAYNIKIENGKAYTLRDTCMLCGHCIAICPENAVLITDYDMSDIIDVMPVKFSADDVMSFIKTRRSIRQYQNRAVDRKTLEQIIEAARFTPTAGNLQGLSFTVVEKNMESFREIVIANLARKGHEFLSSENTPPHLAGYAHKWISIEKSYRKNPAAKDDIFLGAPIAVLISGTNPIDAGLAAANMEHLARANGLGVLFSGFITRGAGYDNAKKAAGVPEGKEVLISLLIGYPDVRYIRSVPRKKANVIWI